MLATQRTNKSVFLVTELESIQIQRFARPFNLAAMYSTLRRKGTKDHWPMDSSVERTYTRIKCAIFVN